MCKNMPWFNVVPQYEEAQPEKQYVLDEKTVKSQILIFPRLTLKKKSLVKH